MSFMIEMCSASGTDSRNALWTGAWMKMPNSNGGLLSRGLVNRSTGIRRRGHLGRALPSRDHARATRSQAASRAPEEPECSPDPRLRCDEGDPGGAVAEGLRHLARGRPVLAG